MTEWWSYTLSDFLLFSSRTYYRLLERHNDAVWPAHILTLGLGLAIFGLLLRPGARQGRVTSGFLVLLWVWVGWMFVWQRYTTINWAAIYLAPLFAVEAFLLVWIGVVRGRLTFCLNRSVSGMLGMATYAFALLVYPMIAPLVGRGWHPAETFGITPDPTAIGTQGLLLLVPGRPRWELLAVPVLWCVITGLTLWAMGSPEAWLPPLAALLTLAASAGKARLALAIKG